MDVGNFKGIRYTLTTDPAFNHPRIPLYLFVNFTLLLKEQKLFREIQSHKSVGNNLLLVVIPATSHQPASHFTLTMEDQLQFILHIICSLCFAFDRV